MQQPAERQSSISETEKYMRGLCPFGCYTNHGGPSAARMLGALWLEWPAETRPTWPDFLEIHGRQRLA